MSAAASGWARLEHRPVAHGNQQVRRSRRDDARAQPGQAEVGRFEPERRGQRRHVGLHRAERRRRLRHADRADRGALRADLDRQHPLADLLPEHGVSSRVGVRCRGGDRAARRQPPPGAQRVVPGGEELHAAAGERAQPPVGMGAGRRQQKRGLRLVELARDAPHLAVVEPARVGDERERVAAERLVGEDVDDGERKGARCPSSGRSGPRRARRPGSAALARRLAAPPANPRCGGLR